jgi:hypothetical protein
VRILAGLGLAALLGSASAQDGTFDAKALEQRLKKLGHTYRAGRWCYGYTEEAATVRTLEPWQRERVVRFLDELEKEDFRKAIGKALDADLADAKTEHGGVINRKDGKLVLDVYYPERFNASLPDAHYLRPPGHRAALAGNDCVAAYHLHAMKRDMSTYAGPSPDDLDAMQGDARRRDGACGVVITSLKDKRFNIDLYFEKRDGRFPVVDLGNYSWK